MRTIASGVGSDAHEDLGPSPALGPPRIRTMVWS